MAEQSQSAGTKKKKLRRAAANARKGVYVAQRRRTMANKLVACKRHVAKHPNDKFGAAQLDARMRGLVK